MFSHGLRRILLTMMARDVVEYHQNSWVVVDENLGHGLKDVLHRKVHSGQCQTQSVVCVLVQSYPSDLVLRTF